MQSCRCVGDGKGAVSDRFSRGDLRAPVARHRRQKKNDVDDDGDRYTPTATVLPLIRLVPNQLDWHILSGDQVLTCNCLVTSRRF